MSSRAYQPRSTTARLQRYVYDYPARIVLPTNKRDLVALASTLGLYFTRAARREILDAIDATLTDHGYHTKDGVVYIRVEEEKRYLPQEIRADADIKMPQI